MICSPCASIHSRVASVTVVAGETQFTVMQLRPSLLGQRLRRSRSRLPWPSSTRRASAPRRVPASEMMLTIRPQRRSVMPSNDGARAVEHAVGDEPHCAVPLSRGRSERRSPPSKAPRPRSLGRDARVVDEYVDRAQFRNDPGDPRLDRGVVRHVERNADRVTAARADLVRTLIRPLLEQIVYGDAHAFCRQRLAISAPMPRPAPVMSATRLVIPRSISSSQ